MVVLLLAACSEGRKPNPGSTPLEPGTPVAPTPSADDVDERARVAGLLSAVASVDASGLAGRYPAPSATTLSYDPLTAANLSLVRGSKIGLTAAEEAVLAQNGFVISDRMKAPTFVYGYASVYADDLPVFISGDSILYAVHRSYDEILKQLELVSLRPTLKLLLEAMRGSLARGALAPLGGDVAKDADLYLAVALGLLDGAAPAPVAGASAAEIGSLLAKATAMDGWQTIVLFGVQRDEDFSQFKPRGHYADSAELQSYFKSMMWLGRTDFRMLETQSDGSQVFRRRQFDGALGLATLVTGSLVAEWDKLDRAIQAFVGESDNMRVPEFAPLLSRLGAADAAATRALDDATIAAAIVAGNYGGQRISSHIMISGLAGGTLPLSRVFMLMGQRYVLDSHVFSNVVFDRVQGGEVLRMMPDPLDVAFAALGNNHAVPLLRPQLEQYRYAPDLAAMRVLADDHGESFWSANLYNLWLSSLRALSNVAAGQTVPLEIAGTEAWGRRTLNTQLASWAELRHDTILYVKQSYTGGVVCEFPDALVEPSPELFARLAAYAAKGKEVATSLFPAGSTLAASVVQHFDQLAAVSGMLKEMAEYQAQGTPFTAAHMAFVNETVKVQPICGGASSSGWYSKLFFNTNPTEFAPTIADVHTQPTDEGGSPVGRVLHVGTGYARLMVLTANTCTGPRVYVGPVSSYHEEITQNFQRLDDATWEQRLLVPSSLPADVPWMSSLIAR